MTILDGIHSPADLRGLSDTQLQDLADEIRDFLITKVSATGGHLGPNLGVVELTIAMHRVFHSPHDPFIFDTSHQSYVHKILTGRAEGFDHLRQKGGLSGYTSRAESEHDWTESSHASASLSYADGLSKAFAISGSTDRTVVALIGDGAMTGGMAWEALNNIAADKKRKVVIIVNDNGRSYAPTIGGFAENLAQLRMRPVYDRVMDLGKNSLNSMGWVGKRTFEALHAIKDGIRSTVVPTEMFPELGIKYIGPIEGHNLHALEEALRYARDYEGSIFVHVVTEKGHGFAPATSNERDQMHSTGVIDPVTGEPIGKSHPGWTPIFAEELLQAGEERDDIVAITAAMAHPTGLVPFAQKFPERFFDVGIAEAHAVTSAAGLSLGGMHPVVAVYSTFLNRGIDQLIMDVGLLHRGVTFVLDRSGVTGSDGASHNGVWDISLTSVVPGLRVAAPRDSQQLRELFREALSVEDAPTVLRFPKGRVPDDLPSLSRLDDGVDILRYTDPQVGRSETSLLLVSAGSFAGLALEVAETLENTYGVGVTVVDPRWIVPIPDSLVALAQSHDLIVTLEDGIIRGGMGSLLGETLSQQRVDTPLRILGFPSVYPPHESRTELLHDVKLDVEGVVATIGKDLEPQIESASSDTVGKLSE